MKRQNTWKTIIIGGLATVAVAAIAIVWSGSRTEDNPQIGPESTNGQVEGPKETDQVAGLDPEDVPVKPSQKDEPTQEETKNPLHDRWEVELLPDESQAADNTQKPDKPDTDSSSQVIYGPTDAPDKDMAEEEPAEPVVGEPVHTLDFTEGQTMLWPVEGNVIQHYSMDTTVYFPTLEQYKCSPAMEIQSEAGTAVLAPADAKVTNIGEDVRIGCYVELEMGNGYRVILGQLTDLQVTKGDYVACGTQIGSVAEPTRYFVVEGDNLYFQMYRGEETVDPLDYLE